MPKKAKITCKHCGLGTTNKDKICAKCKAHIKRLQKADARVKAREAKTNAKAKAKKAITGRIATATKLTGRTQKTSPRKV